MTLSCFYVSLLGRVNVCQYTNCTPASVASVTSLKLKQWSNTLHGWFRETGLQVLGKNCEALSQQRESWHSHTTFGLCGDVLCENWVVWPDSDSTVCRARRFFAQPDATRRSTVWITTNMPPAHANFSAPHLQHFCGWPSSFFPFSISKMYHSILINKSNKTVNS